MARQVLVALLTTLSILTASVKPVERQQPPAVLVNEYIIQVKTALYVINSLKADNSSTSCVDSSLSATLDAEGYDGDYAQQLLCEAAVGIQIFSDLDKAATDIIAVLTDLNSVSDLPDGVMQLPRCNSISVATLNEAGLDGAAIQSVICRAAPLATEQSTSSAETNPLTITTTTSSSAAANSSSAPSTTSSEISETTVTDMISTRLGSSGIPTGTTGAGTSASFFNSAAPRLPSLSGSIPSYAANESAYSGTAATSSPLVTSASTHFVPPIANVSKLPVFGSAPITASISLPVSTGGSKQLPVSSNGTTTSTINTSSVVALSEFSLTLTTRPIISVIPPVSQVNTTTLSTTLKTVISTTVTTATKYTTRWVVGPPLATTSPSEIAEETITVTVDMTTTETFFVTTTITASNMTQGHASVSSRRVPWGWIGSSFPVTWLPSTTAVSRMPTKSAVMTGGSPYGRPNAPMKTATCAEV